MLVKAVLPLRASNTKATYNSASHDERGTITKIFMKCRGSKGGHHDAGGAFGTSIEDGKSAGKPADNTLRLTLLHTPAVNKRYV
jgi:alpha-mannosidase